MEKKDENNYIKKLIDPGLPYLGEMSGAAVSSTIGYFALGPSGAAIGAAGGKVITDLFIWLGKEIDKRYLSGRESARIGAATFFGINRIRHNLENKMLLRTDDFFIRDSITGRSAADEIFEGTIIAAKNEYEEKKLKYYGNLVANIAFHPEIDRVQANFLLKIAERLSYHQICMLTLIKRKPNYPIIPYEPKREFNPNEKAFFLAIGEMKNYGLLKSTNESLIGPGNLTLATLVLDTIGENLHELMNLEEIKKSEINRWEYLLCERA